MSAVTIYRPSGDNYPHNAWAIADAAGWVPGLYATEQAASFAYTTLGNSALETLAARINHVEGLNRAITLEDLESL